jgi:hypothetical protein
VLLGVTTAPPDLSATVVLPADFVEMVSESQIIVHGRVSDVRSHTMGERRSIESLVTVSVTQSLKGDTGAVVVFRVPSGQVGRHRRITVGAPEFRPGDEIVVFLKGRSPVVPMPYGLHQGVYRVQRLARGRTVVTPAPVLAHAADAERMVRGDPAARPITIDAFVAQVRAIAQSGSPRTTAGGAVYAPRAGAVATTPGAAVRPRPERQP